MPDIHLCAETFLVLDFDGVCCDSAPENAATAWRVGKTLWPDRFLDTRVPDEYLKLFCQWGRPYMETGYQAILQLALIHAQAPRRDYASDFPSNLKKLLMTYGVTEKELKLRFGQERDSWLKNDRSGWMSYNRFYPGTAACLKTLRENYGKVVILTTKEDRFVEELFKREDVDFPRENIYGLERIKDKETTLREFLNEARFSRMIFVEDRLETLLRVASLPDLASVQLGFATWGYASDEQQKMAKKMPGLLRLHSLEDLLKPDDELLNPQ